MIPRRSPRLTKRAEERVPEQQPTTQVAQARNTEDPKKQCDQLRSEKDQDTRYAPPESIKARELIKASEREDDPVCFLNDLDGSKRQLVMKYIRQYIQAPIADQESMWGEGLLTGDKAGDMEMEWEEADGPYEIHGEPRWPPKTDIWGNCTSPVTMDDYGRVDLQHDAFCLRKHFTTRWGIPKDHAAHRPYMRSTVEWDDRQWFVGGEHPGIQVYIRKPFERHPGGESPLVDLISSQLLLYRIIANFEVSPSVEHLDPHKMAWCYTLWHQEDPACILHIYDYKGWPRANFRGGRKTSTEALQLFEWLTGQNCPHSYGMLCGQHA